MEYTKKKNWIIAIAVAIVYLTISILFDLWFFLGLYGLPMQFIDLS